MYCKEMNLWRLGKINLISVTNGRRFFPITQQWFPAYPMKEGVVHLNGSTEIFTITNCEQAPDQLSVLRFTKLLIVQDGSLWLPGLTSDETQARNFPHHFWKEVVLFCSLSE